MTGVGFAFFRWRSINFSERLEHEGSWGCYGCRVGWKFLQRRIK